PGGYAMPEMQRMSAEGAPRGIFDEYSVNAASVKTLGKGSFDAPPGAPTRVNFQQLAYFNGGVRTDGQGHASVTFKAPDNLTTWRVLAVAAAAQPDDDPTD